MKEVLRDFRWNRKLYRRRGIGEAIFAGIENRYGAHTRCRRMKKRGLRMLLMLVAHNLHTYMRVQAAVNWFLFLFY